MGKHQLMICTLSVCALSYTVFAMARAPEQTASEQRVPAESSTATVTEPVPTGPVGDWKLVWKDEFDGPGLDTKVWNHGLWFNSVINNELQAYRPENVRIVDGKLVITAEKKATATTWGQPMQYASGLISTREKFSFTYGVAEARVKLPKGKGLWPAFWLKAPRVGKASPPEIDIMENLGHEPQRAYQTYHYVDSEEKDARSGGNWKGDDFSAGFHTFTVEWTPQRIQWYIDGVQRRPAFTAPATAPGAIHNGPMFILLNLAVGGNWPGAPNENTVFPQSYEVDYVRVWQAPATTR